MYKRITEQAAEELRRAAERFEQIATEAETQMRDALEQWEREMEEHRDAR